MKKKSYRKPIGLRRINILFLSFIFILCILLVFSSISLISQFQNYAVSSNQSTTISHAAINLQEASDYLTEEARLFIITTDPSHMENYFNEANQNKRREKAISELKENANNTKSIEYLEDALKESYSLELKELYAIKLVVEGKHFNQNPKIIIPQEITDLQLTPEDAKLSDEYKIAKAWLVMFSEEYLTQKQIISDLKSKAMDEILDYSDQLLYISYSKLKTDFFKIILCIGLIFIFNLLLFSVVIHFVIMPLYHHIKNIRSGNRLEQSNTKEFNVLTETFNEMFDKNEANEILLKHKAEHDEVTGILNRTAFNQIKFAYLNTKDHISLILIDVDYFKEVNDNYGHSTGDLVLQNVANVLKENFRTSDFVARIGGDEFAVILANCDNDEDANKNLIASKLNQIQKDLAKTNSSLPSVSLSCGIAFSSKGYNDHLYEHADAALYAVKRTGRNNFKFYSTDMENAPVKK